MVYEKESKLLKYLFLIEVVSESDEIVTVCLVRFRADCIIDL